MSDTLKERTVSVITSLRMFIAKMFQIFANIFYPDHLLVIKNNKIKRVAADYNHEPFRSWYIKNKNGEAELHISSQTFKFDGSRVELFYDEIDSIVDPSAIKNTEKSKKMEKDGTLDVVLDDYIDENGNPKKGTKGIPVEKEMGYLDPTYMQNVIPYGITSNLFRQIYSDAEESVKNKIPDEDNMLKELGKAVTFIFVGGLMTYIGTTSGSGGGGSIIGGATDGVTNLGFILPFLVSYPGYKINQIRNSNNKSSEKDSAEE